MSVAYVQELVVEKGSLDERTAFRVAGFKNIPELAVCLLKEFPMGAYKVSVYWDLGDDVMETYSCMATLQDDEALIVDDEGTVGKFGKICETTS